MSRLLRNFAAVAAMFMLLIKPDSLAACFPQASSAYNALTLVVFAYLALLAITTLRFSLMTLFVFFFQGYFFVITYLSGGNIDTATFTFLRVVSLCVLIECGLQEDARALVSGCCLCFEIYAIANLLTMIAFPSGLYLSEGTGNACYFLGHKNVLFKVLLPGMLATYLYGILRDGKPGRRFFMFGALVLATEVFVWSASALAVLGFMALLYYLLFRWPAVQSHGVAVASGLGVAGTLLLVVWRLQDLFTVLIVDILHKDLTLTTRTTVWDKAINEIAKSPIYGFGLEDHLTAQMRFGTVESSHNYFLDQLYYGGIVALCILALGLYLVGRGLRRCSSPSVVRGISVVLSGFFILGVVEPLGMGLAYIIVPFVVAYHADMLCANPVYSELDAPEANTSPHHFRKAPAHGTDLNGIGLR